MDYYTINVLIEKNEYYDNVRFECYDGTVFQWGGDHFQTAYNEFTATGKTYQELKVVVIEEYITKLYPH